MRFIHASAALAVSALACAAGAGDLNPPPGPIQPTNRVQLNEQSVTLPYTITEPGSYVLTSNLTGAPNESGIVIAADNVTIDLNGFSLIGDPTSLSAITPELPVGGVQVYQGLTVLDGHIRGWPVYGVNTIASQSLPEPPFERTGIIEDVRLEGLTVGECGQVGIRARGGGPVRIKDCIVKSSGSHGFDVSGSGVVTGCASSENGADGFHFLSHIEASDCVADNNSGAGFSDGSRVHFVNCVASRNNIGFDLDQDSAALDCTSHFNLSHGFRASFNTAVRRCAITRNQGSGVAAPNLGGPSRILITDCQIVSNNVFGIDFGNISGAYVYRNTVVNNFGGAINAPGSDAPVSPSSAGAGPLDNIAP